MAAYHQRKASGKALLAQTADSGSPSNREAPGRATQRFQRAPSKEGSQGNRVKPPSSLHQEDALELSDDSRDKYSREEEEDYPYRPPHRGNPRFTYNSNDGKDLTTPYRPRAFAEHSKFTQRIAQAPLPSRSKLPSNIGKYDGLTNPNNHMVVFTSAGGVA